MAEKQNGWVDESNMNPNAPIEDVKNKPNDNRYKTKQNRTKTQMKYSAGKAGTAE